MNIKPNQRATGDVALGDLNEGDELIDSDGNAWAVEKYLPMNQTALIRGPDYDSRYIDNVDLQDYEVA